jgi:hypothetical protein
MSGFGATVAPEAGTTGIPQKRHSIAERQALDLIHWRPGAIAPIYPRGNERSGGD